MANSGNVSTNVTNSSNLSVDWYVKSQSIAENKTTIHYKFKVVRSKSGWIYGQKFQLKINNNNVYEYTGGKMQVYNDTVLAEGDYDLWHDNSGDKKLDIYIQGAIYTFDVNLWGSGSFWLPKIARYSIMTGATDFYDEENPTITFTNPSNGYFDLRAKIEAGGDNQLITRNIDKYATSYTFNLTEDERNKLRKKAVNSNTLQVRFTICCLLGGTEQNWSYVDRTMTMINREPTLNPTVKDTNSTTINLTGDSNILVRYFSNAQYNVNASAKKFANITSQGCNGGTSSSGTYNGVDIDTFKFYANDSRGNRVEKTIKKEGKYFVPYVKPTCNIEVKGTASGTAEITLTGNNYNGSFGKVGNYLGLQLKWKEYGGSWSDWLTVPRTQTGNTYKGTYILKGLDYKKTYVFEGWTGDNLVTGMFTPEKVFKFEPVFDWGKNDFKLNVTSYMKGKELDTKPEIVKDGGKTCIKYADGTMIFYVGMYSAFDCVYGYSGNLDYGNMGAYGSSSKEIVFPVPFVKSPVVNFAIDGGRIAWIGGFKCTKEKITDVKAISSHGELYTTVYVTAFGNWK